MSEGDSRPGNGTAVAAGPDSSPPRSPVLGRVTTEAEKIEIERLGRQRPAVFSSTWVEACFCLSLLTSMMISEYYISGFQIILPPMTVSLSIPPSAQTWPASVFSLVAGAFLLPFGRLSEMYGGYAVFNGGLAWFGVWSLVGGFSTSYQMLIVCRCLQALGTAAFLPASITLLGGIYRPGPRKNLVFGLYSAFAPLGFFTGILVGGLAGQFLNWRWYIWIGTVAAVIILVISLLSIPRGRRIEERARGAAAAAPPQQTMDWLGTLTIVPGLILVVYALTDASNAPRGFAAPYICVTLVLGALFLAAAFYVEGWVAKCPLLPFELFRTPYMKAMTIALFLSYGTFGIYLFYASFYIELVMEVSPLLSVAYFVPMATGGIFFSTVGGLILHRLPGRLLLVVSALGHGTCCLLFANMPVGASYWAFILPAMIAATVGIDIVYVVSTVFISTSIPVHQQGAAGGLINSLIFLGIGFWLGAADLAVHSRSDHGLRVSYQTAFWLGFTCAAIACLIFVFVKVGAATSELTEEEKEQLRQELEGSQGDSRSTNIDRELVKNEVT